MLAFSTPLNVKELVATPLLVSNTGSPPPLRNVVLFVASSFDVTAPPANWCLSAVALNI